MCHSIYPKCPETSKSIQTESRWRSSGAGEGEMVNGTESPLGDGENLPERDNAGDGCSTL